MARKTKLYITDEELDQQSFPPPSYVDVYPNGPPKRFSQFSNADLTLSTTIIEQPHSSGRIDQLNYSHRSLMANNSSNNNSNRSNDGTTGVFNKTANIFDCILCCIICCRTLVTMIIQHLHV